MTAAVPAPESSIVNAVSRLTLTRNTRGINAAGVRWAQVGTLAEELRYVGIDSFYIYYIRRVKNDINENMDCS